MRIGGSMKYFYMLLILTICTTGCSAGMVNLDPKFQDIDNSIAQHETRLSNIENDLGNSIVQQEARLTALENDYTVCKSSINAAFTMFNQMILDFMPPGFVMCVISSTTAFNWEVKYGTSGVKVTEIIP